MYRPYHDVPNNYHWNGGFSNGSWPDDPRYCRQPWQRDDFAQFSQSRFQYRNCLQQPYPSNHVHEPFTPRYDHRWAPYSNPRARFKREKLNRSNQSNRSIPVYRMLNDEMDLPWHRKETQQIPIHSQPLQHSSPPVLATPYQYQNFWESYVYGNDFETMQTSELQNIEEPSPGVSNDATVGNDVYQSPPGASSSSSPQSSPSVDSIGKERKRKKYPDQPLYVNKLQHKKLSPRASDPPIPSPKQNLEVEPTRKHPSLIQKQENLTFSGAQIRLLQVPNDEPVGGESANATDICIRQKSVLRVPQEEPPDDDSTNATAICKGQKEDDNILLSRAWSSKKVENESSLQYSPHHPGKESGVSRAEDLKFETIISDIEAMQLSQHSRRRISETSDDLTSTETHKDYDDTATGSVVLPDVGSLETVRGITNGCVVINRRRDHSYRNIRRDVIQPYIDSHCHLDFIYNKCNGNLAIWRGSLQPIWHNYFSGCIPNFIDPSLFTESCDNSQYDPAWIQEQVQDQAVLGATYGCHPHFATGYQNTIRNTLIRLIEEREKYKLLAIGECGIDYMRSEGDPKVQKEVFMTQLSLAKAYDLPIVIHCRSGPRGTLNAEETCLEALDEAEISRYHNIHRHCFTENWDVALKWLRRFSNVRFGFTSVISSWEHNDKEKYDVLKRLPLRYMLLETDAPYFRPNQYDCVRNGKSFSPYDKISFPPMAVNVAFVIAKAKNINVNTVIEETTFNARHLYGLPTYE
ncbi:hypothetical protein V3C99_007229 [Haemonchus contortus]